jgi:hypothetical protein
MIEVAQMAREVTLESSAIEDLAKRIRAELFVFELERSKLPEFHNGYFHCVGFVQCRLRAGTEELDVFARQLQESGAYFRYQDLVAKRPMQDSKNWDTDGNFCMKVSLKLRDETKEFHVDLQDYHSTSYPISGSPFTLERLIIQQQMDARFGTSDHRKRSRTEVGAVQRKRRRTEL